MKNSPTPFNRMEVLVHRVSAPEAFELVRDDGQNDHDEVLKATTARCDELEKQNVFIDNLLRSSRDTAIIATDPDLTSTDFNPVTEEFFGYSADMAVGRSVPEVHSHLPGNTKHFHNIVEQVQTEGSYTFTIKPDRGGTSKRIEATLSAIRDNQNGRLNGLMLMARDITKNIARENELKNARIQAEAANKAKSAFLANMSHEIRTPINAIIGMGELLLDTELLPVQSRYLNILTNSATHLLSVINDILDYSKIEEDQISLKLSPFQPNTLIEEIVSTLLLQAQQKGLSLRSQLNSNMNNGGFFLGDSLRLKQVLLNLVNNAIKFTAKGTVTLGLSISPVNRDDLYTLEFTVSDTGVGISREQQKEIFLRFRQFDNSSVRRCGGTGLGLAISNHLVQLMGNKIHVDSCPGKGSTFSFSVLLKKEAEPHVAQELDKKTLPATTQSMLVLLVEDSLANQELAGILLEKLGHHVVIANHGIEALHCLSKQKYDLVLMDIQMPLMDGITATRYIRKFEQESTEDMPECKLISKQLRAQLAGHYTYIIAMTASAMDEDWQRCLDAGMDDYISKPYKKKSFQKIVQEFGSIIAGSEQYLVDIADDGHGQVEEEVLSVESVCGHLMNSYGFEFVESEKIVDTYAGVLQKNLTKLQQAVKDQEGEEAAAQAHGLKGVFLNLGLQEQADLASTLEKELRKEILGRHKVQIERLVDDVQPITKRTALY